MNTLLNPCSLHPSSLPGKTLFCAFNPSKGIWLSHAVTKLAICLRGDAVFVGVFVGHPLNRVWEATE